MRIELGSTIGGKYQLQRLLGEGGMGSVYAAENTLTGKQVAIKCVQEGNARNPQISARLLREAKVAARIRHPNVVDVYDVLTDDNALYLVMEYLEGEPLSTLMARAEAPLGYLIQLLIQAMRGTAAAHRAGIIHRDIKPDNIFLALEGDDAKVVPKVLDFGISKMLDAQDVALTAPGAVPGTILYMSKEQLSGAGDLDARVDIYAFGVLLYQMVTGRLPFEAETLPTLVFRIMSEPPPPLQQLRPDLPDGLRLAIETAMAKQREERPATLEALIAMLEPFTTVALRMPTPSTVDELAARPVVVAARALVDLPEASARRNKTAAWTPWVVALVSLALVGGALWWRRSNTATPMSVVEPAAPEPPALTDKASRDPRLDTTGTTAEPSPVSPTMPREKPAQAFPSPLPTKQDEPATSKEPRGHAPPNKPAKSSAVGHSKPQSATSTTPRPNCNPNYYFDQQGEKHFKAECFE